MELKEMFCLNSAPGTRLHFNTSWLESAVDRTLVSSELAAVKHECSLTIIDVMTHDFTSPFLPENSSLIIQVLQIWCATLSSLISFLLYGGRAWGAFSQTTKVTMFPRGPTPNVKMLTVLSSPFCCCCCLNNYCCCCCATKLNITKY